MRVEVFDFELPSDLIALRPIEPRDRARLLVVEPPGKFADREMKDLPEILKPGDLLVFNDTRVFPAAFEGRRIGRGEGEPRVEALLHERIDGSRWRAFAKPGKRLKPGDRVRFGEPANLCLISALDATVESKGADGEIILAFDFSGPSLDEALTAFGRMPLPPYIASRRSPDDRDRLDYQTMFARLEGAVAAPTAGLHFTPELMASLANRSIEMAFVTLHIGPGTFLPVRGEDTAEHTMHAEKGLISPNAAKRINDAKDAGRRVIAVGTTALRLLEDSCDSEGVAKAFDGETSIFITPGYRFRIADALITNFHLPRSTLFMLVSAFSGLDTMKQAYCHAIACGYRFYSYGDASLLFPARP